MPVEATKKVPLRADGRGRASTNRPGTWATYDEAVAGRDAHGYDGIGLVFSNTDDLMGIDIDRCRDPLTGTLAPVARDIVAAFATYAEVSPSGRGLHLILRGHRPAGSGNRATLRDGIGIEMYEEGRYFTVTGDRVTEAPIHTCQASLDALCGSLWPVETARPGSSVVTSASSVLPRLTDAEVLDKAMGAANGAAFAALWRGDTSAYASHSEADMALLAYLAYWTKGDAERIDRLFRASALMRPKWERPDYRAVSIDKACALTRGRSYGDRL